MNSLKYCERYFLFDFAFLVISNYNLYYPKKHFLFSIYGVPMVVWNPVVSGTQKIYALTGLSPKESFNDFVVKNKEILHWLERP
jgi:hypothetical protein